MLLSWPLGCTQSSGPCCTIRAQQCSCLQWSPAIQSSCHQHRAERHPGFPCWLHPWVQHRPMIRLPKHKYSRLGITVMLLIGFNLQLFLKTVLSPSTKKSAVTTKQPSALLSPYEPNTKENSVAFPSYLLLSSLQSCKFQQTVHPTCTPFGPFFQHCIRVPVTRPLTPNTLQAKGDFRCLLTRRSARFRFYSPASFQCWEKKCRAQGGRETDGRAIQPDSWWEKLGKVAEWECKEQEFPWILKQTP